MPMRVDGDLFDAAKSVGVVASRSAAQQFNHWARIGRELEASPGTSVRDIQRVLDGEAPYDDLGEREQAVVRANWAEKTGALTDQLNLEVEFLQVGREWTEAGGEGQAVSRGTVSSGPVSPGSVSPGNFSPGSVSPD